MYMYKLHIFCLYILDSNLESDISPNCLLFHYWKGIARKKSADIFPTICQLFCGLLGSSIWKEGWDSQSGQPRLESGKSHGPKLPACWPTRTNVCFSICLIKPIFNPIFSGGCTLGGGIGWLAQKKGVFTETPHVGHHEAPRHVAHRGEAITRIHRHRNACERLGWTSETAMGMMMMMMMMMMLHGCFIYLYISV